ncbi:uncharacterized protein C2E21_7131 [Chlorella sorokiniana]|uniref:Uncharacterized protein n=1 Tax=Chlorella sorokiniana TaxID=3076 RepID=A0A2P6TIV1_CHLSO|nr:uncharacterized protein C2E21_7131 [Chlorella sorokiniana]|eukprot:PRW39160.1 uncharacterized protein C2E21_7131 [Chlorella sorokiniana]
MKAARTFALCALLLVVMAGPAAARKARHGVPAPAPAPATAEEALIEGAAIMRAALESGFELTPEELALLDQQTGAAPAPAPASEEIPARRLLHNGEHHHEAVAAPAPAPATAEEAPIEGAAIMRAAQEAGFELTPEELALLEQESSAVPAPAPEAEPMAMRRLLEEEAAPAPAPAAEDALLEGAAIMRAALESGFELTPEELALLEQESGAAPAPAPEAEPMALRRLLEEEAAPAPAPTAEDALLEGAAIMRAALESGFELTPEELALLEQEAGAALAPAPEAEPMAMRRLLEEEAAPAPAPTAEDALLEGAAIMRAALESGFELTPEELALLEQESGAAPAPTPEA